MNWYIHVLKNYANFNGRARRKEYWMFALINTIISYAILFLSMALIEISGFDISFFETLYSLAVFIPTLAVGVRRMHDVGKSGWCIIIPFYNLYLAIKAGDVGLNKYGKDPKNNFDEIEEIGTSLES